MMLGRGWIRVGGGGMKDGERGSEVSVTFRFSRRFLEKYTIVKKLGAGGMGEVYLGIQRSLKRYVAIKTLNVRGILKPSRIEMFDNEARLCASLNHPNIVLLYDYPGKKEIVEGRERPYMVFEYVDGMSLSQLIERKGALPLPRALEIAMAICRGLECAHNAGIVHKDMKSENILIDKQGHVKIADFGIAVMHSSADEGGKAGQGKVIGTPAYMSPEQVSGEVVTPRSDLYSVGVILYEMLTGSLPFDGPNAMAIVMKHVSEPAPPPSGKRPELPPALDELVLKALEKRPEDRFESAAQMAGHLEGIRKLLGLRRSRSRTRISRMKAGKGVGSSSTSSSLSIAVDDEEEKSLRKKMLLAAGALLLVFLLLGAGAWYWFAPPFEVKNLSVVCGFTKIRMDWETEPSACCKVVVRSDGGEMAFERAESRAMETHSMLIEGLKDGCGYEVGIYPASVRADEAPLVSRRVSTRIGAFEGFSVRPGIDVVVLEWRTEVPMSSSVKVISDGQESSVLHSPSPQKRHYYTAVIPPMSREYSVRAEIWPKDAGFSRLAAVCRQPLVIRVSVLRRLIARLEGDWSFIYGRRFNQLRKWFSPEHKRRLEERIAPLCRLVAPSMPWYYLFQPEDERLWREKIDAYESLWPLKRYLLRARIHRGAKPSFDVDSLFAPLFHESSKVPAGFEPVSTMRFGGKGLRLGATRKLLASVRLEGEGRHRRRIPWKESLDEPPSEVLIKAIFEGMDRVFSSCAGKDAVAGLVIEFSNWGRETYLRLDFGDYVLVMFGPRDRYGDVPRSGKCCILFPPRMLGSRGRMSLAGVSLDLDYFSGSNLRYSDREGVVEIKSMSFGVFPLEQLEAELHWEPEVRYEFE